jgi:hypothetical protein
VRAVMVVVQELSQHPSEMTLADHDDVVETLPADSLREPFRDRVRFGARGGARTTLVLSQTDFIPSTTWEAAQPSF